MKWSTPITMILPGLINTLFHKLNFSSEVEVPLHYHWDTKSALMMHSALRNDGKYGKNNELCCSHSGFSQTHTIDNSCQFVSQYNCNFLLFHHMMLVNVKLNVSGYKRITFQICRLHWFRPFLVAQLRWIWKYCHSCFAERLWKTLAVRMFLKATGIDKSMHKKCWRFQQPTSVRE